MERPGEERVESPGGWWWERLAESKCGHQQGEDPVEGFNVEIVLRPDLSTLRACLR